MRGSGILELAVALLGRTTVRKPAAGEIESQNLAFPVWNYCLLLLSFFLFSIYFNFIFHILRKFKGWRAINFYLQKSSMPANKSRVVCFQSD